MYRVSLSLSLLLVVFAGAAETEQEPSNKNLPFPKDFEPARYLGKWHEVARFPTPVQPADSLATAEYALGDEPGLVLVTNTAYKADGTLLRRMQGKAQLQSGSPPGRLAVSFGPVLPSTPNYHVMYVDKDYQHAVVGNPDRKSLLGSCARGARRQGPAREVDFDCQGGWVRCRKTRRW